MRREGNEGAGQGDWGTPTLGKPSPTSLGEKKGGRSMSRVNVYDGEEVIAAVEYNANLDRWDGNNWTSGSTGRHKGLTRLKDGRYVLIRGTQWQGERDTGEIISADQALQEILQAEAAELLEKPMFAELKAMRDKTLATEWEATEE